MSSRISSEPDMRADVTVGVDIGGTTTRVVAFGPAGDVLAERLSPTPRGGAAVIDHVAAEFAAVAGGRAVRHVGVGIPGRVTAEGSVAMALNVGIIEPVPLAAELGARLGVPVAVENDVNAAAVAALAAIGVGSSLTYISIGTGFAVGSIVEGAVVRGATGGAGEIGHVPIPGETVPCVCGQRGCIEAIVSGRALSDAAGALGLGAAPTVTDLWNAAETGNAEALALQARAVAALAWSAQVAVLMLDVDHVVFGGGVSDLGTRLLDPIRAVLRAREAQSPWLASVGPAARLRLAPGNGHLGAIGADLSARRRLGSPGEPA